MKKAEKAVAIIVAVGLTLCSVIVAYAADPYIANGSETGNITVKNYSSDNNYAWVRIIDVLWSSIFVTLMAKKYHLLIKLPFLLYAG